MDRTAVESEAAPTSAEFSSISGATPRLRAVRVLKLAPPSVERIAWDFRPVGTTAQRTVEEVATNLPPRSGVNGLSSVAKLSPPFRDERSTARSPDETDSHTCLP